MYRNKFFFSKKSRDHKKNYGLVKIAHLNFPKVFQDFIFGHL
jgi:hypothetical protein